MAHPEEQKWLKYAEKNPITLSEQLPYLLYSLYSIRMREGDYRPFDGNCHRHVLGGYLPNSWQIAAFRQFGELASRGEESEFIAIDTNDYSSYPQGEALNQQYPNVAFQTLNVSSIHKLAPVHTVTLDHTIQYMTEGEIAAMVEGLTQALTPDGLAFVIHRPRGLFHRFSFLNGGCKVHSNTAYQNSDIIKRFDPLKHVWEMDFKPRYRPLTSLLVFARSDSSYPASRGCTGVVENNERYRKVSEDLGIVHTW